jgi:hypothetical protein
LYRSIAPLQASKLVVVKTDAPMVRFCAVFVT